MVVPLYVYIGESYRLNDESNRIRVEWHCTSVEDSINHRIIRSDTMRYGIVVNNTHPANDKKVITMPNAKDNGLTQRTCAIAV